MKKIIASLLILTQLCLIAEPMTFVPIAPSQAQQQQVVMGTNAYEDAEKLTEMDKILREVAERNEKASELNLESYHDSTKGVATGAGSAAVDFGLGMGINGVTKNIGKGKPNVKTDTQSTPSDWDFKKKGFPTWELALIALFVKNETREGFNDSKTDNKTKIDSSDFQSNITNMKNSNDPRTKVVVTIFKIIAHLSQEVGKKVARATGGLIAVGAAIEVLLIYFKEMMDPNEENLHTFSSIFKAVLPQIVFSTIIMGLISSGLLWQFYIGPLLSLSITIGGLIGGKVFTLQTLPDMITKLFNLPFEVMWKGIKMMFSFKMFINEFTPILVVLSGVFLLFLVFHAIVEMMQILIDYILIGIFGTVVLGFMVLGITKNIGSGVINAFLAAMMNVIIMFALTGLVFKLIDNFDNSDLSTARILATICTIYISVIMLSLVKTIGMSIHNGTNASVDGSTVINKLVDAVFAVVSVVTFYGAVKQIGIKELAKKIGQDQLKEKGEKVFNKATGNAFSGLNKFTEGFKGLKNQENMADFFDKYKENVNQANRIRDAIKAGLTGDPNADPMKMFSGKKSDELAERQRQNKISGKVEDLLKGQQRIESSRKQNNGSPWKEGMPKQTQTFNPDNAGEATKQAYQTQAEDYENPEQSEDTSDTTEEA